RSLSIVPEVDPATRALGLIDVCGTGGDHQNTFNISTTVAIVVASAGIPVAKHGNRAITSRSGSADVLEALGIQIDLDPATAAAWLRTHHFAFFFAPRYHPAFKNIAPARKLCAKEGQRTLFNFLGPLLNPARPDIQLVGVSQPALCEPLARVLQSLGLRRAMVACGRAGAHYLDELSTVGETTIADFHHELGISLSTLSPHLFPIQPVTIRDLAVDDRESSAIVVSRILAGEDRGPKRDATILNASAALFLCGRTKSLIEAWDLADELLDSGRASAKLGELQQASRQNT
ncbi:MAG: anthranilate phosphoribosyltransferase, partial [Verrucomicrobiales bacterium]|nr:anthranilate phosphoribosyltransferase [Verrucomicrobiales bacterium]